MINIKKKIKFHPFRTGFADEKIINQEENDIYSIVSTDEDEIKISEVEIFKKNRYLDKEPGTYISIEFDDVTDKDNKDLVVSKLQKYLKKIIAKTIKDESIKAMIVGLGNKEIKADALGPMVASNILVTNHLFHFAPEVLTKGSVPVAVLAPGVMGQTGLETSDIISSVVKTYRPNLIIAIDALATKSITRINKVIQISNTGISPGSGIGNFRKSLNEKTLKTPVIAIGVATVVDAASIVLETLELVNESGKGQVNINQKEDFIRSVLIETGFNYIVTPKEIDEDMRNISYIISEAINASLHSDYRIM